MSNCPIQEFFTQHYFFIFLTWCWLDAWPHIFYKRIWKLHFQVDGMEGRTYWRTSTIPINISAIDFFLWGRLKSKIYSTQPNSLQVFWEKILNECCHITPEMYHSNSNKITTIVWKSVDVILKFNQISRKYFFLIFYAFKLQFSGSVE